MIACGPPLIVDAIANAEPTLHSCAHLRNAKSNQPHVLHGVNINTTLRPLVMVIQLANGRLGEFLHIVRPLALNSTKSRAKEVHSANGRRVAKSLVIASRIARHVCNNLIVHGMGLRAPICFVHAVQTVSLTPFIAFIPITNATCDALY